MTDTHTSTITLSVEADVQQNALVLDLGQGVTVAIPQGQIWALIQLVAQKAQELDI